MTTDDLIRSLDKNFPAPFYFLYGPERFYQNEILGALTQKLITPDNREFNLETFDAKTSLVADWIDGAQTLSFLGGQKLVIVRNLHEAMPDKTSADTLLEYTKAPFSSSCLVITADKVDRKRKLDKGLTGLKTSVDCNPPKEPALVSWIKGRAAFLGYNLSYDAAKMMVDRVGCKPGLLAAELEKVTTFAGDITNIDETMTAHLVGCNKLENVFVLTDALKNKKAASAIQLLRNQLEHGEEPLKVFGAIAWQFRFIWEVKHYQQRGMPTQQIAREMGTKPFLVDKAARYAAQFSREALRRGFDSLFQSAWELKTSAKAPERVLESLILSLCSTR
ncbi:MAG: DNA polymerase III subunit delta [Nitrospinota bacterium]|nr:DNA polymerase III subunit delta [Nitrospinota bacterium]